jgi:hypothetical protein
MTAVNQTEDDAWNGESQRWATDAGLGYITFLQAAAPEPPTRDGIVYAIRAQIDRARIVRPPAQRTHGGHGGRRTADWRGAVARWWQGGDSAPGGVGAWPATRRPHRRARPGGRRLRVQAVLDQGIGGLVWGPWCARRGDR